MEIVNSQLAKALISNEAKKATKYLSDRMVVKASRRLFGGKISKRDSRIEILFTQGIPNVEERDFIKKCKKAGMSFPIQKIQLKFPPKK